MNKKISTAINAAISLILALTALTGCEENTTIHATGISINTESVTITKGESYQLTASLTPEGAEEIAIIWSTSNGNIATVDNNGIVSGILPGECTITARAGSLSASCNVTVSGIPVESVSLDKSELTMVIGTKQTIYAEVTPDDAEDRAVTWSSSDENIASVNYLGEITANNFGEATISATAGGKSASCKVTVRGIPVESITLNISETEMNVGKTLTLTATVMPENATDKTITWSSSDDKIASVDKEGTVTANSIGKVTITAKSGEASAECIISVIETPVPEKGDFYYADGTWSKELDQNKEVIGIVFWTGDPTSQDNTLRKDHPDCNHGLVIAISGEQKISWQSGYKEYKQTVGSWVEANTDFDTPTTGTGDGERINFINGYNNTKAYESFNNASENSKWKVEALDAISSHSERVPAPEASSGWYFPSAKEMSLLCAGDCEGGIWYHRNIETRDQINERLALIDNAEQLAAGYYWTSSENTFDNAVILYFGVGYPDLCPKEYAICIVRPVLAF